MVSFCVVLDLEVPFFFLGKAKDLGQESPMWERMLKRHLDARDWNAFALNYRLGAKESSLGLIWSRLIASAVGVQDEGPALPGIMPMVIANMAENGRRVAASGAPSTGGAGNNEAVWKVNRTLLERLTSSSKFVPIFGAALETTARKLVYRLMWGKEEVPPLYPVVGVFPGTSGMGGGVSFNIEGTEVRLAPFYSWEKEVKQNETLNGIIGQSDGITFVVDDAALDSPEEQVNMRRTIEMVLSVARAAAPVLVLSFAVENNHTHDPRQAMHKLGLDQLRGRSICLRNVPESTDTGVAEGFAWLKQVMQ